MANTNFYEELDLRYPEIAICIEQIDRTNPGTRKFYLPVLTPTVDTTSLTEKKQTIRQSGNTIANKDSVKVDNVEIQNYLLIPIPKELCAFVGGDFNVKNVGELEFDTSGTITISGSTSRAGGLTEHSHSTLVGDGETRYYGKKTSYKGILNSIPTDKYRYIPKGSKWIVVFIGGDINKPQIIGRYTDPS